MGEAVSEFGNAFHLVALPWLVFQLGGDLRQLGLVVAVGGVGRLAAVPIGGVCADRFGARRVMLVSDIGRAALTLALVVAGGGILTVAVLAGALGLLAGVFQPAAMSVTPSLLPAKHLQAGLALSTTVTFAAGLTGPAVAGVIVAVLDPGTALLVDAVTFALSAAFLVAAGPLTKASRNAGAAGGLRQFLRESALLRTVLLVTGVANLTMGGLSRVGFPTAGGDPAGLGALLAGFTGGCLVGGLVVAGLPEVRRKGVGAMVCGVITALAVLAVPFFGLGAAVTLVFVAGAASSVTNVLMVTVLQQHVPGAQLGRVMAAVTFCGLGLFPVSAVAAGFVVSRFGVTSVFVVTGVLLLVAFGYGLTRKAITNA
jgi:predicted MFS family arabinose efflux permease